jgi:environmental stress-induced protein Ves
MGANGLSPLSSFTPFAIDALRCEPWRNGAGWTRTICAQQPSTAPSMQANGASKQPPLWRISVADITAAGQFSQFEGMDRTAVMVQGGRLQLSNDAVQLDFDGIGSQIQFPGEWSLYCSEPQVPTQLLNIMVQRGQAAARVQVLENTALTLASGTQQLVLVLRGSFRLQSPDGGSQTLQARHGLHWQALDAGWSVEPQGADAVLVCCSLS